MTDNDDILKQLLRTNGYDLLREEPIYVNPDGPKAADEIERLRAELAAELERADARRKTVSMLCRENAEMEADRDKAEAERDALRAELAAERELVQLWAIDAGKFEYERDALRAQLAEACGALEAVSAGLHSVRPTINVACIDLTSIRRARAVLEKIKGGGDD